MARRTAETAQREADELRALQAAGIQTVTLEEFQAGESGKGESENEEESTALVPYVQDVETEEKANDGINPQERAPVAIDENAPWAEWPEPRIINTRLHDLMLVDELEEVAVPGSEPPATETVHRVKFVATHGDDEGADVEVLGAATTAGLRLLGWQQGVTFPVDFVEKLSPPLRVEVVNERILAGRDRELAVVVERDEVTNIAAGWRGVAPYKEVAQVAFNTLRDVYGDCFIEGDPRRDSEGMHLRLMTPMREEITPKEGDVLQMGVDVRQKYGTAIDVALYVKRLVCLNGMMANETAFQWKQKATGTVEHQLQWLRIAVSDALGAYENLVERSREMADTPIHGDPLLVLEERARAMRLPKNLHRQLREMFNEEPEATEWGMLNAFTRLATHGGIGQVASRNLMFASGQWTSDFDMVNARLPRPMAVAGGFEILT